MHFAGRIFAVVQYAPFDAKVILLFSNTWYLENLNADKREAGEEEGEGETGEGEGREGREEKWQEGEGKYNVD